MKNNCVNEEQVVGGERQILSLIEFVRLVVAYNQYCLVNRWKMTIFYVNTYYDLSQYLLVKLGNYH